METALHDGSQDNAVEVARVMTAARALEPQIKAAVETMETDRRLFPSLVQAMKEAGIFRMAVARAYGGLEFPPAAVPIFCGPI